MITNIIKSEEFKTTKWPGGKTTELYIHPPISNYSKGNFDFRISTASVDAEKSKFTILPGISRQLMVLSGSIILLHNNHHQNRLNKGDMDIFDGGWETTSIGKCVDFNLMTKGNVKGDISSIFKLSNETINYKINSRCEFIFFYAYESKLIINFSIEKARNQAWENALILCEAGEPNLASVIETTDSIISRVAERIINPGEYSKIALSLVRFLESNDIAKNLVLLKGKV